MPRSKDERSLFDTDSDPAEAERPKRRVGRPAGRGLLRTVTDETSGEDLERIAAWQDRFQHSIGNYDPGEFYVRSTDEKGHMDKTSLSYPQGLGSLIAQVVDEVPHYSSSQAFIRDSIIHRMAQLCYQYEVNDRLKNSIDIERQSKGMDMVVDNMNRQKAQVEKLEAGLTEAEKARDWKTYEDLLTRAEYMVENLGHPFNEDMRTSTKRGWETFVRYGRPALEEQAKKWEETV